MKKGMLALIVGIILLILSFPPNFSSIREYYYKQSVHNKYEMKKVIIEGTSYFIEDNGNFGLESVGNTYIMEETGPPRETTESEIQLVDAQLGKIGDKGTFEQTFHYGANIIKIKDQFPLKKSHDPANFFPKTASYPIEIIVNGRSFQNTKPITLHPSDLEADRYSNEFGMLLVKEISTKQESLLMIQRFGKDWSVKESRWKFLWVSKDGQTKVETFDNEQRKDVPYRTAFINEALITPTLLGYKSDDALYYPSIFVPLLYPWVTTLLGLFLTIFGAVRQLLYTKPTAAE
jgi:hypothetical protein